VADWGTASAAVVAAERIGAKVVDAHKKPSDLVGLTGTAQPKANRMPLTLEACFLSTNKPVAHYTD
jgi:hypothetical protein